MSSSKALENDIINKVYTNHLNEIVSVIKTIADNDKTDKSQNTKEALACFTFLGQKPDELCPHGKKFFACMPCSH
jgi:hypothetical protein